MEFKFTRHAAGTVPSSRTASEYREMQPSAAGPLVSCLMVTRGNVALVASAFACFRAQTWHNKELVVVCDNVTAELRALLDSDARVRLIEVTQKLALGDLRNLSVASSKGTYVCQWDDDDLYDPRRIAVQMGLIMSANVMAVFLSRWLIWWPARDVLALSGRRQWEGSMLAHRSVISVYPSMSRGEDSQIARLIADYHPTVLVDCPQMYCYRVTGENTFDASHFEQMLAHATKIFSDQEKRSMLSLPCFNQVRGTAA
jgi:glycosyltransferase involved in cell wall biosynthesis